MGQFVPGQIGARSFLKGDYGKESTPGDEENKDNQACPELVEWSQTHTDALTKGMGKREKSLGIAPY